MDEDDLIKFVRERLTIRVRTESHYTGDMGGSGNLYSDSHTVELLLDDEVISSDSF